MPRFYFDLVDDIKVHDKKGVSLPDIDAAREYAKTFARELIEEKPTLMGESHAAWSVQVCNGRFERVLRIPFASLITTARPSAIVADPKAATNPDTSAGE
jgi:hypothetical protein